MIRLATTSDIPRLLELLHQVTVTAMQKAERGCATYTPMMFYKVYRLLAKIVPNALMVKFTSVEGSTK